MSNRYSNDDDEEAQTEAAKAQADRIADQQKKALDEAEKRLMNYFYPPRCGGCCPD